MEPLKENPPVPKNPDKKNAPAGRAPAKRKNVGRKNGKITTRGWLEQYSKQVEELEDITAEKKEKLADAGLDDITGDII